MENTTKIKGGVGDNMSLDNIAKKFNITISNLENELNMGIKIEMEHTNDKTLAKDIAMDHLTEIPDYYTRLSKMEVSALKRWDKKDIKKKVRESLNEAFKHNNQFLYHTTNIRNYDEIKRYGLLPQFGDTVKQAYGGYYDLGDNDNVDDEDGERPIKLDFDGLLFFSEYPMLGYSQTMQQNFKLNEALVCVIKKNSTIYHKVEDYPKFTDYRGQLVDSIDYNSVYNLPIIIETGDWFTFQEQSPVMLLEGRYIIEFMNKNFPQELKRYIN